jgi:hypothetical protein
MELNNNSLPTCLSLQSRNTPTPTPWTLPLGLPHLPHLPLLPCLLPRLPPLGGGAVQAGPVASAPGPGGLRVIVAAEFKIILCFSGLQDPRLHPQPDRCFGSGRCRSTPPWHNVKLVPNSQFSQYENSRGFSLVPLVLELRSDIAKFVRALSQCQILPGNRGRGVAAPSKREVGLVGVPQRTSQN